MSAAEEPLRLHIGGQTPLASWKILDIAPGEHVDYVGDCANLCQFADGDVPTLPSTSTASTRRDRIRA